ncbi:adenylate/guanylate cyclase domain-containing protein [Nocardioides sp. LHG3406-4]|uniref:adenylate/guanylate cyclase domain-containing protein n=1 Tax=Nocardioides sp. LHG3406-4 TaxID=2804575 RepID=UPI003CF79791
MADAETGRVEASDDLAGALDVVEAFLLGERPHLTRQEVADRAGVGLEVAMQLWRLLGFPHAADDDPAFTESDVTALRTTDELMRLGVIDEESQAALVRTWGRSFARLAEWQTALLAGIAVEGDDPGERLAELTTGVLPRVETLQTYVWRRHLASATHRMLETSSGTETTMAVGFVDIVGYTARSRSLDERELITWIEHFEQEATVAVVDHGGRVIKTIGDEILYVADDPDAAVEIALTLTARGDDEADAFPVVRAGVAHGEVLSRLGDVYGPTVNIASRLTSVARPGSVVVDRGVYAALSGQEDDPETDHAESAAYRFRRLGRASVKGYSRLQPWRVRRA